jgi:hypothetical protein
MERGFWMKSLALLMAFAALTTVSLTEEPAQVIPQSLKEERTLKPCPKKAFDTLSSAMEKCREESSQPVLCTRQIIDLGLSLGAYCDVNHVQLRSDSILTQTK